MTFPSRWGWHPCDYQTYQLLKRLHTAYWRALRQFTAWQRWRRKQPQNRVIREWLRDDQDRLIGARVVGPRPEPPLCPVFCSRSFIVSHTSEDGRHLREGKIGERVSFCGHGIAEAYRAARTPLPSPDTVRPLGLFLDTMQRLAAQLQEVYPGE